MTKIQIFPELLPHKKGIHPDFLAAAKKARVVIRDTNGKVY